MTDVVGPDILWVMSRRKKILVFILFLTFFVQEKGITPFVPQEKYPTFLKGVSEIEYNVGDFSEIVFVKPDIPPFQILNGKLAEKEEIQRKEVLEYEISAGETISSIAEKFGISVETIVWANNLAPNQKLKNGEKLIILPVDGVLHQVKKGETISEIAKRYKADPNEILEFNDIQGNEIVPGDIIIVPGGKMPPASKFVQTFIPIVKSAFLCPLPPCKISQGLHWYNAVDFSNGKCNELVLAADSGKVIMAKYGWNGGAGTTIKILHSSGVITQYGHLSEILVEVGQEVYRGQPIGRVGGIPGLIGSGISTGCHLHFGVIGAKNPFSY